MQGQLPELTTGSASRLPSLAPLHEPTVSVVVGTWSDERWADVTRVVAALREQTLEPREVILVVDGNPALLERAEAAFPDVRCVANVLGRGAAGARNTGVREATGDVVAFVDDDAEPEPT
jgi:glycosyltransferase involved in cell wall biosynthesis